ncbi:MAG: glycosyltransferase [Pseudomonas sp.]|uniref:glycosyltransferase n=1 Tax=Pseudomonas sp. TaxID=306 RepID=UPI0011FD88EC|nr:glycosyltransferase [Pseudomonas sp.]RZI76986.1 MAG: glycosyltransferase [Pseudomonas sp.]
MRQIKLTPQIAVAVPVRNEVARLPGLLLALAQQRGAPAFTLCLFLDECDDGSAEVIQGMESQLPFAVVTRSCNQGRSANAGAARRRAMELALDVAPGGLLMTTDADSQPSRNWLAANLAALRQADVVAGKIVRSASREPDRLDRLCAYYDRLHETRRLIDPVPWESFPSHHWTSAASLALHARHYVELGGFEERPAGEDAALADAAARAGLRLRRDGEVLVATSSRRKGRAPGGFATTLAALDTCAEEPQVAHPEDEVWRFRLQAKARRVHRSENMTELAAEVSLSMGEVMQVARVSRNGEAFASRVVCAPPHGMRMVSLSHAEALLMALQTDMLKGVA